MSVSAANAASLYGSRAPQRDESCLVIYTRGVPVGDLLRMVTGLKEVPYRFELAGDSRAEWLRPRLGTPLGRGWGGLAPAVVDRRAERQARAQIG